MAERCRRRSRDYRTALRAQCHLPLDDDTYTTILSAEALHYRDERGAWQSIDPAFRSCGDSFVVEHNSITSRAGLCRAWLSAAVDRTVLIWEATELGLSAAAGDFISLARALPASNMPAQKRDSDRVLHYTDGWSVSSLSEEISSAPDSVEHSLIVQEPLQLDATQSYLELRATLELLPGATRWADDQPIEKQIRAAQTLQVRDAAGEIAIVFERVCAFEQQSPDQEVTGDYVVYATNDPATWMIGMRRPRAWWAAEARHYPVVLEPTMYVKRSTGFADGLAWVRSTDDFAYTLGDIKLGSHLPHYNTRTRGYVPFNSLPALLSNAPVQVISASLDVEPQAPRRGSSSAAGAVSAVDQEEIVAASSSQIVEQIGRWTNGAPA